MCSAPWETVWFPATTVTPRTSTRSRRCSSIASAAASSLKTAESVSKIMRWDKTYSQRRKEEAGGLRRIQQRSLTHLSDSLRSITSASSPIVVLC